MQLRFITLGVFAAAMLAAAQEKPITAEQRLTIREAELAATKEIAQLLAVKLRVFEQTEKATAAQQKYGELLKATEADCHCSIDPLTLVSKPKDTK